MADLNNYYTYGDKPFIDSSNPKKGIAVNPFELLGIGTPPPGQYGAEGNTPQQDAEAARRSGNPMPSPTSYGGTVPGAPDNLRRFMDSFEFQNAVQGTPQWMFNEIKNTYGVNTAWSWALNNAWNHLGGWKEGSIPLAMSNAGISNEDRNRIINTYAGSSKSKYYDGLRYSMSNLGTGFDPNSPYSKYQQQLNALNPSNITYPGSNTTPNPPPTTPPVTPPTTNPNAPTTPTVNVNLPNQNNPYSYGGAQSAMNFGGYNPYQFNNLPSSPYSTFNTQSNNGDTSINTKPITGVSG